MFKIKWAKIDKFYLVLSLVLILLSILVIFTFREIFGAYITAYELEESTIDWQLRVNEERLGEAYQFVFEKEIVEFNLR